MRPAALAGRCTRVIEGALQWGRTRCSAHSGRGIPRPCPVTTHRLHTRSIERACGWETAVVRRRGGGTLRRDVWVRSVAGAADGRGGLQGDGRASVVLRVDGMKCGGCVAAVERRLMGVPGVHTAEVNLLTGTAVVHLDASAVSTSDLESNGVPSPQVQRLQKALSEGGFSAREPPAGHADGPAQGPAEAQSTLAQQAAREAAEASRRALVAFPLAVAATALHLAHAGLLPAALATGLHCAGPWFAAALGATAVFGPGRQLLIDGIKKLRALEPNMNSLVMCGAVSSLVAGVAQLLHPALGLPACYASEPAMLLGFVLAGRAAEARARAACMTDVGAVASLLPADARLCVGDRTLSVRAAGLKPGDVVVVRAGEAFPADGVVVMGKCWAQEGAFTGEPTAVRREEGDSVMAGVTNRDGMVRVRVTKPPAQSLAAGILREVERAQARRAPLQSIADKIAGRFCVGVMATSLATLLFWSTAGATLFPQVVAGNPPALLAARLAVGVLVVACPCSMGLATPTAVLVATSLAARRGVLIRGGDVLERLAKVDTVMLDKTGTITHGELRVEDVEPVECAAMFERSELRVLSLAAAVEQASTHPAAKAIVQHAREREVHVPEVTNAVTVAGEGAYGTVEGQQVYVGSLRWVRKQAGYGIGVPKQTTSDQVEVAVAVEGLGLVGVIRARDTVRTEAGATVEALQGMGMRTCMLSGDRKHPVNACAKVVGIHADDAFWGVSPLGKAGLLRAMAAEEDHVAMVGDGLNDAPAMLAADVGVAVQGGLDATRQVAGVVLMGDRINSLPLAFSLARSTVRTIKQNLAWSLAYNVVALPAAAGVLLPVCGAALEPAIGAGCMALSSIAVVGNSLRLRWTHRERRGTTARARRYI
ncbi:unnamed protein product [Pedinophyceae sp. YPF-701]|nr:unnamed protein product [Pedinophyceae sp. YPF-701]